MWVVHYVLGLLFYLTINTSIWIENAPMLASKLPVLHSPAPTLSKVEISSPTQFEWRLFIIPLAILRAQYLQHSYHRYLFDLRTSSKTYQLPSYPSFPNLLCPHYTCEVAIYFFLSFLAAPAGQMVNWTLICATIFVAVNLGVTAQGTKEWYVKQFGIEKVKGRRKMVPGLW
jgi:3-oxo-5-alpha-steroid 4-dehydrogenase 3